MDPAASVPEPPRTLSEFLEHFLRNIRDDNYLAVKYGNYSVTGEEVQGETVDWTMQYLQYMSCPANLEAGLTKVVLDEAKLQYLPSGEVSAGSTMSLAASSAADEVDASPTNAMAQHKTVFKSMNLLQNVTTTVNEVCKRLKREEKEGTSIPSDGTNGTIPTGRVALCSVAAVKNGRRKMEDRHVVIHDLNMIYADQLPADPPVSFYGVYDGHAGKDAAAFAASHIHGKIISSKLYPHDTVGAIREAFLGTDQVFLEKGQKETLRSGTTAVCSLIRGNTIYSAWLGDSQSVLVRKGRTVRIIDPHKPNREDEKKRIEALGGTVIFWGTWRVNGQLAVSRAIGDGDYKPYVSAEPDVTTVEMNGSEDFLIIACDGLWDTVTPEEAVKSVFASIKENKDNLGLVSNNLVTLAKEKGSTDNITIVVVFLRPISELIDLYNTTYSIDQSADASDLLAGVTSTSAYIDSSVHNSSSTMNGRDDDDFNNPYASPMTTAENGKQQLFDSPLGGGRMFGDSPDPFASAAAANSALVAGQAGIGEGVEQFKHASPSMFEPSLSSPALEVRMRGGHEDDEDDVDEADFMANQQHSWIHQHNSNLAPVIKGDSGFISPAGGASVHQSASSEDSAENHMDREASPEDVRTNAMGHMERDEMFGGSHAVRGGDHFYQESSRGYHDQDQMFGGDQRHQEKDHFKSHDLYEDEHSGIHIGQDPYASEFVDHAKQHIGHDVFASEHIDQKQHFKHDDLYDDQHSRHNVGQGHIDQKEHFKQHDMYEDEVRDHLDHAKQQHFGIDHDAYASEHVDREAFAKQHIDRDAFGSEHINADVYTSKEQFGRDPYDDQEFASAHDDRTLYIHPQHIGLDHHAMDHKYQEEYSRDDIERDVFNRGGHAGDHFLGENKADRYNVEADYVAQDGHLNRDSFATDSKAHDNFSAGHEDHFKGHFDNKEVDDEEEEGREVTNLLAKASGGHLPQELMDLARKSHSPSSGEDDDNASLEDILAVARSHPEQLSAVEQAEDDDDSSSSEEDEADPPSSLPPQAKAPELPEQHEQDSQRKRQWEEEEGETSSSEETGEGFTFVKTEEAIAAGDLKSLGSPPVHFQAEVPDVDHSGDYHREQAHLQESLKDERDIDVQGERALAFDLIGDLSNKRQGVFEMPVLANINHEYESDQVPAVSTLNVVEAETSSHHQQQEEIDSSAPSSMESQSGPSSVIVESQEVPSPDHASFIMKSGEDSSITPQAAVREVIEDQTSSQSPIPEESEEKATPHEAEHFNQKTPSSADDMFSERSFGFEAPVSSGGFTLKTPQESAQPGDAESDHEHADEEMEGTHIHENHDSNNTHLSKDDEFHHGNSAAGHAEMEITNTKTHIEDIDDESRKSPCRLATPGISVIPATPNTPSVADHTDESKENVEPVIETRSIQENESAAVSEDVPEAKESVGTKVAEALAGTKSITGDKLSKKDAGVKKAAKPAAAATSPEKKKPAGVVDKTPTKPKTTAAPPKAAAPKVAAPKVPASPSKAASPTKASAPAARPATSATAAAARTTSAAPKTAPARPASATVTKKPAAPSTTAATKKPLGAAVAAKPEAGKPAAARPASAPKPTVPRVAAKPAPPKPTVAEKKPPTAATRVTAAPKPPSAAAAKPAAARPTSAANGTTAKPAVAKTNGPATSAAARKPLTNGTAAAKSAAPKPATARPASSASSSASSSARTKPAASNTNGGAPKPATRTVAAPKTTTASGPAAAARRPLSGVASAGVKKSPAKSSPVKSDPKVKEEISSPQSAEKSASAVAEESGANGDGLPPQSEEQAPPAYTESAL